MTDAEIFRKWLDKLDVINTEQWASKIPLNEILQYLNYSLENDACGFERYMDTSAILTELKTRDIPEELKLEVLLLLGDK